MMSIDEVIKINKGQYSLFSQIVWLSENESIAYLVSLAVVFAVLLSLLLINVKKKNRNGATVISLLIAGFAITTLILEYLLFSKPI